MSYEHCDGHDMDATNGCPVCNIQTHGIADALCLLDRGIEAKTLELWEYIYEACRRAEKAERERDELRAAWHFHGGHSCRVAGGEWKRLQDLEDARLNASKPRKGRAYK